uniref:Enhancer of mRNA-decapping protein 4 WD40 repeat region domain-containing protein n=1 Tax=Anopheles atroparvus TaxID=41427 RepID=A0AAG5DAX7_ANOAO
MDTTENTLSSSPAASGNKMFVFSPEENQLSFKTSDKNITVKCSGGAHDRGSSKIKLIDVVSYKWEVKHYPGRLIACHKECKLFAYAITVTKLSKSEGMVRVAQLQVAERGIIRGLSNEVLDIQFAHTSSPDYLLGIIERTTLQVHQVFVKGNKVTTALKVKIVDPLEGHVPVCDRINWCPYLRENDYEIDDFASQLLVWTRGSTFQCYSISTLTKTYADTSDLKACDIDEGGFKANDADATVTGSVFSADGTTLALSSTDGMIRFYQVYQHANDCTPRRLHQWKPHGGRPVSSFFFLDNYTETVGDKVLWKHAITCADNNTEIRVWCCESWECLQAVRLESPMAQSLNFKAEIDLSSTYLVLSDMNTRQIYVLQIRKGQSGRSGLPSPSSSSRDPDQAQGEPQWKSRTASLARGTVIRRAEQSSIKPHIVSIAEYPISRMILGFSIIYARVGNYLLREQDDDDEDQSLPSCIVIRMFLVQSGVIQDCTLVYDPVDENECDVLAIAEEGNVGAIDCEVDGNDTQTSQSSASSSSSSTETTDNNLSHPPSEASDQSVERKTKAELNASTGAPKASAEESSDGSASGSNSNNDSREDDEEEENGGHGNATSNLLKLKMAEAAQKLNEALDALSPGTASAVEAATNASGPTTPASTGKVNLMTPESFSTPSGRGSRSAKDGSAPPQKDVRIINLSELPYPEVETIMSQFDRRRGRGRGRVTAATGGNTAAPSSRKNDSSVTSTASANGSVCSSDSGSTSEEEGGAGGNNTSVASIAGSERVANITDDPDEDDDNRDEEEEEEEVDREEAVVAGGGKPAEVVTTNGKEQNARAGLANGSPHGSAEQSKKKMHGGGMLTVSGTVLSVEHFTKILTLDEAEPPTVREKNKSDETVNPNVLSTLFMLANATKQQQAHMVSSSAALKATTAQPAQPPPAPPTVATLQAFVNMVQSRAATEEANSSKAPTGKQRKSTNGPMEGSEGAGSVSVPPEIPPMPSAEMLASGGSSPSREVQEIMSTKGSGTSMMVDDLFQFMCTPGQRKDVYDDEEEEEVELDVHTLSVAQGNTSNINHQFDEEDGVVQVTTNGQPEDTQDEVDAKEKMEGANSNAEEAATSSEEKAGDADAPAGDQMDQVSSTIGLLDAKEVAGGAGEVESLKDTAAAPFWPSKVPTELPESPLEVNNSLKRSSMPTVGGGSMTSSSSVPPAVLVVDSSKQLEALTGKLDCMMELLVAQSRQIEEMNGQLEAMKKAKNDEQRRYSALVNRLQQTLPKAIETQINSCFVSNSAKLEQSLLASLGSRQAQLLDALKQTVSQALMAQLPERVSALVIRDVQQKLLPPIASKLEVLQHTLSQDVVTQLRYFEVSIQEAIQRTIQSEQFVSKFSMNLSIAVHSDMRRIVEKAHEEAMRNRILPSYDASTQEMFRQITVCFSGGLKDFMRKIDEHIARVAETQVRANDLGELLRILPDKITASGDRSTANTVRMIREHLEKDMKMLQAPLLKTIRDHIRHEIEKGFEAQASSLEDSVLSVVRSQAQTPAPSNMDVQEQIKQYLNGGQINKAFHKALLSNDLSLVEFLLERADHKQVFNPCPLEQTVLLSLIQQISADMSNHNELKHKYLSDAIVNLDFHDPVTKEHSPKVMLELLTNCQAFMAANPTSSLCTSLKMVIIAIQYMGVKQF